MNGGIQASGIAEDLKPRMLRSLLGQVEKRDQFPGALSGALRSEKGHAMVGNIGMGNQIDSIKRSL